MQPAEAFNREPAELSYLFHLIKGLRASKGGCCTCASSEGQLLFTQLVNPGTNTCRQHFKNCSLKFMAHL